MVAALTQMKDFHGYILLTFCAIPRNKKKIRNQVHDKFEYLLYKV